MSTAVTTAVAVSTHILDTSVGRPAEGVAVRLAGPHRDRTRTGGRSAAPRPMRTGGARTCRRCRRAPPTYGSTSRSSRTSAARTASRGAAGRPRVRDSGAFFPEVAITFAVKPGEHYHVPLLLNPFGYSVYRGS